ncbi:ParB N-terminal domain-containing protein, partial [Salmonella enterica]|nr:ParB N-terminal domain-containing protein [Salmonella enterica]
MLHLNYDITGLRGAEYNPRFIGDDDLSRLAESVAELGLVKPLIVRGDLLVAGHQRTKALRRLGITRAAVYTLPCETTVYDEVRFNQLHNGTDFDSGDERCRVSGLADKNGFVQVPADQIIGNMRAKMAYVRKNIADLV